MKSLQIISRKDWSRHDGLASSRGAFLTCQKIAINILQHRKLSFYLLQKILLYIYILYLEIFRFMTICQADSLYQKNISKSMQVRCGKSMFFWKLLGRQKKHILLHYMIYYDIIFDFHGQLNFEYIA